MTFKSLSDLSTDRTACGPPTAGDKPDNGFVVALALQRLAERGLVHGNADEQALAVSVLRYLEHGAEGPLEAALGLAGPGWTGALRRLRQARRDDALRRLRRIQWPDLSANAAAQIIATRWSRYESGAYRRRAHVPSGDPDTTFHRLLDVGHQPLAAETIRGIFSREVGDLKPVETPNQTTDLGDERRSP